MLRAEVIDRIRTFDSGGRPIVSLYLSIDPDPAARRSIPARLKDLLRPVKELLDAGELNRDAHMSLRGDVDAIMGLADHLGPHLGKGVAIFSSSAAGLLETVGLPAAPRDRSVVDATPHVRPMMAILDEFHRYCAVVVDRRRATIHGFWMGELVALDTADNAGGGKRNFGGWHGLDEHRVRNHADAETHRHYRETATRVEELVRRYGIDLVLVGGHEETVSEFIPFLPASLRERVAGAFTVDPHTASPAIVRDRCEELIEAYERDEERAMVAELMEAVGSGGRGVLGLEDTVEAANLAAIDLLLIHDDHSASGGVCDDCGLLAVEATTCAVCGKEMRLTPDLVDELVEDVVDEGGRVEHVYAETPLTESGIGALTRFVIRQS